MHKKSDLHALKKKINKSFAIFLIVAQSLDAFTAHTPRTNLILGLHNWPPINTFITLGKKQECEGKQAWWTTWFSGKHRQTSCKAQDLKFFKCQKQQQKSKQNRKQVTFDLPPFARNHVLSRSSDLLALEVAPGLFCYFCTDLVNLFHLFMSLR